MSFLPNDSLLDGLRHAYRPLRDRFNSRSNTGARGRKSARVCSSRTLRNARCARIRAPLRPQAGSIGQVLVATSKHSTISQPGSVARMTFPTLISFGAFASRSPPWRPRTLTTSPCSTRCCTAFTRMWGVTHDTRGSPLGWTPRGHGAEPDTTADAMSSLRTWSVSRP